MGADVWKELIAGAPCPAFGSGFEASRAAPRAPSQMCSAVCRGGGFLAASLPPSLLAVLPEA